MILLPAANEQGEVSGLETFGQRLLFIKNNAATHRKFMFENKLFF